MQWIVCLPFHSSEFSQTYFSESIHQHTWALLESVRQTIWIPFRISCKWRASNECRAYFSAISLTEKPQDECQADPHCPFRRHTFSRNLFVLSCESGSKRLRWLECSTKNHDHVTWEEPFVHCSFFFFICFFQVLHDFIIFIFSDCLGAFFFSSFCSFFWRKKCRCFLTRFFFSACRCFASWKPTKAPTSRLSRGSRKKWRLTVVTVKRFKLGKSHDFLTLPRHLDMLAVHIFKYMII